MVFCTMAERFPAASLNCTATSLPTSPGESDQFTLVANGWNTAPLAFWDHYALVADNRAQAQQWLDGPLMDLLQAWPTTAVQQATPFILQVQRGRVYLRMEYPQPDVPTLRHAVAVFIQACTSAQLLNQD